MNTFEIISLALNSFLVLLGAGTIWVVFLIYKFQKKDFEKSKREDIQPKPEVTVIGYSEAPEKKGYVNIKFLYNPARKVVLLSYSSESLRFENFNKILNLPVETVFSLKFRKIDGITKFEDLTYSFEIKYEDLKGNKYNSHFDCKGNKIVDHKIIEK